MNSDGCAPSSTEYDTVQYPSWLFSQTHPDRLATLAVLHGLSPARVDQCRILELGCGDGTNLLAMAFELPESQCCGIDLAGQAIARGKDRIRALGLKNILLHHLDLLAAPPDLGRFDYIICHGLYSWVPEVVRDKIMRLCRDHLSSNGVAYISYNAYPGNHLRDLVRRMIQFHVRPFKDPAEKVRQARSLIKFLGGAKTEPDLWQNLLQQQYQRMLSYTEEGYYHDDLSSINQPFYFYEFVEHAARHGLQYLTEAVLSDLSTDEFSPEALALLQETGSGGPLAREQYIDFLKGRSFRQTLICHQSAAVDRTLSPERLFNLLVAGDTQPVQAGLNPSSSDTVDFQGPKKAVIATGHPAAKAALIELGERWPERVPFAELLNRARERLGMAKTAPPGPRQPQEDAMLLGAFLLRAYQVGFVDLHVLAGNFNPKVSERPQASPLARFLAQTEPAVPTLRHLPLRFEDSLSAHVVQLLDGTNNRETLFDRLRDLLQTGQAAMQRDGQPVTELAESIRLLDQNLDANLRHLARAGVLMA